MTVRVLRKKCHHHIGIKGRRSRPLKKSTTAAASAVTPSSVAAADSFTSMSADTDAKTLPVNKKKRPKFGAIINLLRLGKKKNKKNKKKTTTI